LIRCADFNSELPDSGRYCSGCGAAVGGSVSDVTATHMGSFNPSISAPSSDNVRFIPGAVLAMRYRIIELLGRGGMCEIYRADDLKLGQQVALELLPASVESSSGHGAVRRSPTSASPAVS